MHAPLVTVEGMARSGGEATIPKGKRTPVERFFYSFAVGCLGAAALMSLFVVWAGQQSYGVSLPLTSVLPLTFGLLGALAAFVAFTTWRRTPGAVHLTDSGITVDYPLRDKRLPWSEVMKPVFVGWGVVNFYPNSTNPDKVVGGSLSVTYSQARAILADPRCPPVKFTEAQKRDLDSTEQEGQWFPLRLSRP